MTVSSSKALRQSTGYCFAQNEAISHALCMAQRNLCIATVKNALNEDEYSSQPKQVPSKQKQKTVTRDTFESIGKSSPRNNHTVRGTIYMRKESNVATAKKENMTDNQVGTSGGNDDGTLVSNNNENNFLEHSDQRGPSTGTIIDHNSTDSNCIIDLPDLTVLLIINDSKQTNHTEKSKNNSMLTQCDAKIAALKKIMTPTQMIHASHSTTGFPYDDSAVSDELSATVNEFSL